MTATRIDVLDHRILFDTVRDGDAGKAPRYCRRFRRDRTGERLWMARGLIGVIVWQ